MMKKKKMYNDAVRAQTKPAAQVQKNDTKVAQKNGVKKDNNMKLTVNDDQKRKKEKK